MQHHLWHPYTRFSTMREKWPVIEKGRGIYLTDHDGKKYIDAISSWWCCNLGHGHPRIVRAIQKQSQKLQHSILGNLSHRPALELAKQLADLMPDAQRHVLFASDGSSAVEQALKIAIQYWNNLGKTGRTRFACLQDAYHGDTLGAMSMGYLETFHRPFKNFLMSADRLPFPADGSFETSKKILERHRNKYAAVIMEPLCQGAAGMRMYPPSYLKSLSQWCRKNHVLLIIDEIAMGFWRTGKMFAFEHAGIDPDIVCVGKALSAGYLPISATIVKDKIYKTFNKHTLQHGHTFSGNPIAAAAALEALSIYSKKSFAADLKKKISYLHKKMDIFTKLSMVKEVRCLGLIAAIELHAGSKPHDIRKKLLTRGILLRPLGNVLYLMPPLTITHKELNSLIQNLYRCILE